MARWQWTLHTPVLSATWSGPLGAGIDHTVDLLVPQQAASLADADAEARVEIDGVDSLTTYAAVVQLLQSVPGVRRANVVAADPGSVTFASPYAAAPRDWSRRWTGWRTWCAAPAAPRGWSTASRRAEPR